MMCVVALLAAGSLFAAGKTEEDDFERVDGTGNWQHEIDVTDREPGKYNILVRVIDAAGNVSLGGPYNVFVDPDSDKPGVFISSPAEGERIGTNVTIVGSATDDDGVDRVEVRVDDGEYSVAEGTDFWSYYLDIAQLDDGLHTVYARSIDTVNPDDPNKTTPAVSEEVSVTIAVDRSAPEAAHDSHSSGILVSGRTTVEGRVSDANAIAELYVVTETGERSIRLGRGPVFEAAFRFDIDPRKVEQGPHVWWIRAVDEVGSRRDSPFFFYVDTEPPVLEIISPAEGDVVDGSLSIAGSIGDGLGITSFTYDAGDAGAGTIEMTPGDPYFSLFLDYTELGSRRADVLFTIEDIAGNATRERVRFDLDHQSDKPQVALTSPEPDSIVRRLAVAGFVVDDDRPAAIHYQLDDQPPVRVETGGGFSFDVPDVTPGRHDLRYWAEDVHGTIGDQTRIRFEVDTPPGAIALDGVLKGEEAREFVAGERFSARERITFRGLVSADQPPDRVHLRIGEIDSKLRVDDAGVFTFRLPRDAASGILPISLWYTSLGGDTVRWGSFVVVVPEPEDEEPVATIPDVVADGVYLGYDPQDWPADAESLAYLDATRAETDPRDDPIPYLYLPPGQSIGGILVGPEVFEDYVPPPPPEPEVPADPAAGEAEGDAETDATDASEQGAESTDDESAADIASPESAPPAEPEVIPPPAAEVEVTYRLVPDVPFLTVSGNGRSIVLTAEGEGSVDSVQIEAVYAGETLTSWPIAITTEIGAPSVTITSPEDDAWLSELTEVTVTIEEPGQVRELEYRVRAIGDDPELGLVVDSPNWVDIMDSFETGIFAPTLPSGKRELILEVRAVDEGGREARETASFVITDEPPQLRLIAPPGEEAVNGVTTLLLEAVDVAALESVEVETTDGTEALQVTKLIPYQVNLGSTAAPRFVLVDRAGNRGEFVASPTIDEESDIPEVRIQNPDDGAVIRDDFRVTGVLLDDDAPQAVRYRIDDSPYTEIESGSTFNIDVAIADLDDGPHVIEVIGIDQAGAESPPVARTFMVSHGEPTSEVDSPSIDEFVRGVITVVGRSEDPNGIAKVEVSVDNGTLFQRVDGTDEWSYRLDTESLADGTQSIVVRATDSVGTTGMYTTILNIDNSAPYLDIALPHDGDLINQNGTVANGRVEDETLQSVVVSLVPVSTLDGEPVVPDDTYNPASFILGSFDQPGPFDLPFSAEPFDDGWYSLVVTAIDAADNEARVSRNLRLEAVEVTDPPDIRAPRHGESLSGAFSIVIATEPFATITINANGLAVDVIEANADGIGRYEVSPEAIPNGEVEIAVSATFPGIDGDTVTMPSQPITVVYDHLGPWLTIDSPDPYAYLTDRPFVTGRAGYEMDLPEGDDPDVNRERRDLERSGQVERVEVSLDNGRTFDPAAGGDEWRYRLETQTMQDGPVRLIVRARFVDGSVAVRRASYVIDETPPSVDLIAPAERTATDDAFSVVGTAADANGLRDVAVVLREGDKSSYEVPSFIQGLYLDAHFLGATFWDIGFGLTFFDDNVRLQAQLGGAPDGRFSGMVVGAKLLANVFSLPFSFIFGPDLSFLSAAIAIGANFSYYTMSGETLSFAPAPGQQGTIVSAVVGQVEFPIFSFEKLTVFNTVSFYTEVQAWFISSDIEAGVEPRLSFGIRANLL